MSENRTLRLPDDLSEAAAIRAAQLGYKTWTAYVLGLIRYDMMVQGEHTVTLPLSHARPAEMDRLDADLLERCKTGRGVRGQWLEKAIARIAGDAKVEDVKGKLPDAVKVDDAENS